MPIFKLDDLAPRIADSAWVADNATVVGKVVLEDQASLWFNVVLRADVELIRIGRGSNVQDGTVVHADYGFPTLVGEDVTIGHAVMLHGCTIGDGSLVGIQSVILNGAKIGRHCLVGAGSLVTEGKEFPEGSLIVGAPARVIRQLKPEQISGLQRSAEHYRENARRFRQGLQRIDAIR